MPDEALVSKELAVLPPETTPHESLALQVPYSVFSKSQRRWVTLIIGMAMMFSPLSANMYLPCIPMLQRDMHTSLQLINLTITTYVIIQGIAPAFFGELSDKIGRRPIYIITFSIYIAASIGLAVQDRYIALLLLRMLQSLGASATVAIGYGVVADIVTPAERGRMLGPAMVATNLGPVLGPVIGGPLADAAGWRWIFWLLAILGSAFLFAILLFLPESCRSIVGNGSIPAGRWSNHWTSYISGASVNKLPKDPKCTEAGKNLLSMKKRVKCVLPNPWKSLRLLFEKDTSLVLSVSAIFYTVYYITQASIPALLSYIYGFNATNIGLCYFAIGSGVMLGTYINEPQLRISDSINKVAGDDLKKFPIERARSRFATIYVVLHTACLVAYGWALNQKIHVAGPLILQFCIGFLAAFIVQTFNTLLVDIHGDTPSTAAAAGNIARCALSAGGVAVMQPLLERLRDGVFFTMLGCVSGVFGLGSIYFIRRCGMRWRVEREDKKVVQEADLEERQRPADPCDTNCIESGNCGNQSSEVPGKSQ